ncbi:hypothetical protein MA16_Dca024507 [Dendrobium catenatum]|uniref:Uncharacterized protein n=1 Tax=Dendrobium catenatum TaxID=906689 RepID=A0A2I0X9L2_9ASPA|nr:hypothetical protein MA16_Dca024507 [Dendrobium catenatum]
MSLWRIMHTWMHHSMVNQEMAYMICLGVYVHELLGKRGLDDLWYLAPDKLYGKAPYVSQSDFFFFDKLSE